MTKETTNNSSEKPKKKNRKRGVRRRSSRPTGHVKQQPKKLQEPLKYVTKKPSPPIPDGKIDPLHPAASAPEEVNKPKPITFEQGTNKHNAFIIQKHEREIEYILRGVFKDKENKSNYFILNEVNSNLPSSNGFTKFRILYVEDINGFKYQLWFNVSNLSLI
jgi:hypothetical protein